MHVLLIHQVFAGPDDPGGTRHFEIGRQLVRAGHRFTVITSAVNYLTGEAAERPTTPLPDGMRDHPHRGRGTTSTAATRRAPAASSASPAARCAPRWRVPDVDVVWGTSPPLVQLVPAWLASRRCRGGLRAGGARPLARVRGRHGRRARRRARPRRPAPEALPLPPRPARGDQLAGLPALPRRLRRAGREDPRRAQRRRRASSSIPPLAARHGAPRGAPTDRFVVLYAGALGPANGLDIALDAGALLRDTRALFVLVGDGKARGELAAAVAARGLDNVLLVPAQPKRAMRDVLGAADACLATLRDIPLFRTTYPNKVFDYMAAGRPVLLAIDGVIRDVVERARAGIFVPPGDGARARGGGSAPRRGARRGASHGRARASGGLRAIRPPPARRGLRAPAARAGAGERRREGRGASRTAEA